jgi:hypothetical protein
MFSITRGVTHTYGTENGYRIINVIMYNIFIE